MFVINLFGNFKTIWTVVLWRLYTAHTGQIALFLLLTLVCDSRCQKAVVIFLMLLVRSLSALKTNVMFPFNNPVIINRLLFHDHLLEIKSEATSFYTFWHNSALDFILFWQSSLFCEIILKALESFEVSKAYIRLSVICSG